MPVYPRGPHSIEDDSGDGDSGPSEFQGGPERAGVSEYRRQPPRATKDQIYEALLDGRWHSACELYDLVGVDYLVALAELVRSGYSINRNKNSFTLISRWPLLPGRKTNALEVEARISGLIGGIDHSVEEDLNFIRLGDEQEESFDGGLELDGGEGFDPDEFVDDEGPAPAGEYQDEAPPDDVLMIGEGVGLPGKLTVTLKIAILAKSGAGKTSSAIVVAEEMCRNGLPFCVIDPMGVWWGLRSGAGDGDEGFPVLVLGGDHGDVILDKAHGSLTAKMVVGRYPKPTILDLSLMTPDEQHSFVAAFGAELYARNRRPLHLFVDEADEFSPQRPEGPVQKAVLGIMDRLVRRGRLRGIGITLITQRSAVLHKNVLSQVDMLVAMCSVSPSDLKAIREWVDGKVDQSAVSECLRSLPSLPVGAGYILASGRLNVFKKLLFRKKKTYDASATPGFDDDIAEDPILASVDDLESVLEFMNAAKRRTLGDVSGDGDENEHHDGEG